MAAFHPLALLLASSALCSAVAACSVSASYALCSEDCDGAGGAAGEMPGIAGGIGTNGDTGEAGSRSGVEPEPGCDRTKSPLGEPCLVDDAFAVFVRSGGAAIGGDGSEQRPFGTLAAAIELAEAQRKSVLVCGGLFTEALELVGRRRSHRLEIVGGFDCSLAEWRLGGPATQIQPTSGPALHLDDAHDVRLTGMHLLARASELPGGSSVAAIIEGSTGIELERVTLSAAMGKNGANGAASPARVSRALDGHPPTESGAASARNDCACNTSGGRGGNRAATASADGGRGLPDLGAGAGGDGGAMCSDGAAGANAKAGKAGFGASSLGALDGSSWRPADGLPGEDGNVAQGGGGGGGDSDGYGGGGACGGCGGKGGAGGGGGGASIGLLLLDSEVTLSECSITTADGGRGGNGRPGQPGQLGGLGGISANACSGGNGGNGGDGGPGGGGAGGTSVGILYRGAAPAVFGNTTWSIGTPGRGGDGGGSDNHGLPGESAELLRL